MHEMRLQEPQLAARVAELFEEYHVVTRDIKRLNHMTI